MKNVFAALILLAAGGLVRCKTHGDAAKASKDPQANARQVETIGTVIGHPGSIGVDPSPLFDYYWNGKLYQGIEHHTSFFVEGEKYVVTIPDSTFPSYGKLRFDNPVFLDTEHVVQLAGRIVQSDVYGIVYDYSVNGITYKKELFKSNVNAAATGKKLFLVLASPKNPGRSIIFPDEPLDHEDSLSLPAKTLTYGEWLRRGIYRSNAPIDPSYAAHGAYYCLPDAADSSLMKKYYSSPWLELAWQERKLRFDKQVEVLKRLGIPVFRLEKKSVMFSCDDGLGVFFDLHQYKNPYAIILFNGTDRPVVRDAYVDDADYFYRKFFGKDRT